MGGMACLWVLASACVFDTTAPPSSQDAPSVDAAPAPAPPDIDAAPDGPGTEPPLPACLDDDGDGYFVPTRPESACGPVDCNDFSADVFPGQVGAFVEPNEISGFDYNCDGVETRLVEHPEGGRCRLEFFSCEGSGWAAGEPACGQSGVWHRCEAGFFSCNETDRVTVTMPCN